MVFQAMVFHDGVRTSEMKINQIAHHICWLFRCLLRPGRYLAEDGVGKF